MRILLTLDYELFFGRKVGTPEASLVTASEKLIAVLDEFGWKAVFFVDATYLLRLKKLKAGSSILKADYELVVDHIKSLEARGHQIQLHLHPHWNDSNWTKDSWTLNTNRYRFSLWDKEAASSLISESVQELNSHLADKVTVYRAGGWCIQPFSHISDALYREGVVTDSTVYRGGYSKSRTHRFDFREVPEEGPWRFEDDPCTVDNSGRFLEIPISSIEVSPIFYWKFATRRILRKDLKDKSFGDGVAIAKSKVDTLELLARKSSTVVSIDGYKASLLEKAFLQEYKRGANYFVVIGHPKALTNFSLGRVRRWLSAVKESGLYLETF
ncbi:polysaccharide deacetylase family protein [Microbulbifer yueqingensis]|uniref:Polysaccharide deacetylase n=1 Tax=Microbulbifer yueqingensis TaxID=658219 RepID=A0A1G8VL41_9GAMM|nr:polysaccharide deacetylase family protein [Microbulbifer yueqingensis]SDJ66703.1 Polysaccharide deacetylase [Microbulbifer yueqingensis]